VTKTMTMDCDEAIQYVKTNIKTYDNVELSYNRVFTPGEVINIETCVLKGGRKSCSVMVQLSGDTLRNTVEVDLEEIKYDLIEVRHIPQEGEEILITIERCDSDLE